MNYFMPPFCLSLESEDEERKKIQPRYLIGEKFTSYLLFCLGNENEVKTCIDRGN